MVGLVVERAADREHVGLAEQLLEADQAHAELLRDLGIGVGVVGDELHAEGLGEPEHLGADVADAELAERPADQADAHVLVALGPALGALAGDPVLGRSLPVSASMKVMIETATGRRTPSGVITSAQSWSVQAWTLTVS